MNMVCLQFVTIDVFTTQPYTGNPLAIVFLPPNKDEADLSHGQKQLIASEFNLSETVFLHPGSADGEQAKGKIRKIDIFTTESELPFAGHPTIGAASWLLCLSPDEMKSGLVETLNTKSGNIPIQQVKSAEGPSTAVTASVAHNVRIHAASYPLQKLLKIHPPLAAFFPSEGYEQEAVGFPIVSIVNGMTQVHVELPSLDALAAVGISASGSNGAVECGYLDKGWESGLVLTYFYVRGVEDPLMGKQVIRARSIVGNIEDPATGSAASGLAAYLTLVKGNSGQHHYDIVQGVEMGRRSDLGIEVVTKEKGKIESVELQGAAVAVSEGRILVP